MGSRIYSNGSQALDSFYEASGDAGIFLDAAAATYPDQIPSDWHTVAAGSGYAVGDIITPTITGATCPTPPVLQVTSISPLTLGAIQAGKCTTPPTGTLATTGGTGSGMTVAVTAWENNAAVALTQGAKIYGNASAIRPVSGTRFSNSTVLGADYLDDSATNGWEFYLSGASVGNFSTSGLTLTGNLTVSGSGNNTLAGALTTVSGAFLTSSGRRVATRSQTTGTSGTITTADEVVIINKGTGSATPLSLNSTTNIGRTVTVKDGKGDAATNNITITPTSGLIDGASTYVINTAYGAVRLVFDGTNWQVISKINS